MATSKSTVFIHPNRMFCISFVLFSTLLITFLEHALVPVDISANDAAVETGIGGILQLQRQEKIAMLSELLVITEHQVTVEYEFKNLSQHPRTTEIAFPIPPFAYPWEDIHQNRTFNDFQVLVDGKDVTYDTEIRAFVDEKEVTSFLRQLQISPETFGGYNHLKEPHEGDYRVEQLSQGQIQQLVNMGIIDETYGYHPNWSVALNYHWSQTFPPNRILRIKHSYTPVSGFHYIPARELFTAHPDACLEKSRLGDIDWQSDEYIHVSWVKYILTTANTWRTPIDNFALRVESPESRFGHQPFVSFCWDAPVQHHEDGSLEVRMQDFIPDEELIVYFFERMK